MGENGRVTRGDVGWFIGRSSWASLMALGVLMLSFHLLPRVYDPNTCKESTASSILAQLQALGIYGTDGTDSRAIKTDSDGHLQVDVVSGEISTGSISVNLSAAGGDSVVAHGHDGTSPRAILTRSNGKVILFDTNLADAIDSNPSIPSTVVVAQLHGRMQAATNASLVYGPTPTLTTDYFPSAGVGMWVVSTSADDDNGGTANGAYRVKLVGLDENWNYAEVQVFLSGTTAVNSGASFTRLFSAHVTKVKGYHNANVGTIRIQNQLANTEYLSIPAGEGSGSVGLYTIPTGRTGYIRGVTTTGGSTMTDCTIVCKTMTDADATADPYTTLINVFYQQNSGGAAAFFPSTYIKVPEKTDIWCEGSCVSPNTAALAVTVDIAHVA